MRCSRPSHANTALLLVLLAFAAPAAADNLVASGNFDRPDAVAAWKVDGPGGVTIEMLFDGAVDAAACDGSGSGKLRTSGTGTYTAYYEICAGAVDAGLQYATELAVLHTVEDSHGELYWGFAWFEGEECSGAEVASASIGPLGSAPDWQPHVMTSSVPQGAASVMVRLELDYRNAPEPLVLHIDRVVLRPIDEVFDDGFESGSVCRWAAPAG